MSDRAALANRLRDFFELQLRLAEHIAARTSQPLGDVVLRSTRFHRAFGFGDPDRGQAPAWAGYAARLDALESTADRTDWTLAFFRNAPQETPPPDQHLFGCFACEAPDARGVMRIHFANIDSDGLGPLHRSKVDIRRCELRTMFAFVRQTYPQAVRVQGVSWLYHLDAYRRLFPPCYGQSALPATRVRLCGMSSWGQFISHDGAIKPGLRDMFLDSFDAMDVAAPWRSFPLPAMTAQAPVTTFGRYYEAGDGSSGDRPRTSAPVPTRA